jgi:flagellar protein FliO/FliZ
MSNNPTPPAPKSPRAAPALIGAGVLVIALGFGLPRLLPGADPVPEPREPTTKQTVPAPIQPPNTAGLGAALLKLAVGLVVVCGLCVLVARKIGPKPPVAPGAMEVVASIAVAQCVLHLVRAGDRRLLIGTDLGGVKAVLELPGPEPERPPEPPPAPAAAASSDGTDPPTRNEILNLLLQLRTRTGAPPPG